MKESIELKLIGITYTQTESGVYALVLEDIEKSRRLAIVIGYPEAQSIECHLQGIRTPRPLSHELMANLVESLNAKLLRVDIEKLQSGPYAGILTFVDAKGDIKVVDARSSDAIALAIRVGAPIFADVELMLKEGFPASATPVKNPHNESQTDILKKPKSTAENLKHIPLEKLKEELAKKVEEEKYEEAEKIRLEIERRKKIS